MTLAPVAKFGPYEILSHIGSGDMGELSGQCHNKRHDKTIRYHVSLLNPFAEFPLDGNEGK
jgi:hypothetical protein